MTMEYDFFSMQYDFFSFVNSDDASFVYRHKYTPRNVMFDRLCLMSEYMSCTDLEMPLIFLLTSQLSSREGPRKFSNVLSSPFSVQCFYSPLIVCPHSTPYHLSVNYSHFREGGRERKS